jgi:hypothetical protein
MHGPTNVKKKKQLKYRVENGPFCLGTLLMIDHSCKTHAYGSLLLS